MSWAPARPSASGREVRSDVVRTDEVRLGARRGSTCSGVHGSAEKKRHADGYEPPTGHRAIVSDTHDISNGRDGSLRVNVRRAASPAPRANPLIRRPGLVAGRVVTGTQALSGRTQAGESIRR
jgi:hypothetical protein